MCFLNVPPWVLILPQSIGLHGLHTLVIQILLGFMCMGIPCGAVWFMLFACHCQWILNGLSHLWMNKVATISQTIFSDALSWMKSFVFRLKVHLNFFLRVQLTITQHWFRWWRQAIIWTNVDPIYWHICGTKERWRKKIKVLLNPSPVKLPPHRFRGQWFDSLAPGRFKWNFRFSS